MSNKVFNVPCSFRRRFFLSIFLLCSITACSNGESDKQSASDDLVDHRADDWATIPLPDLSQQPVKLRVASVVNPRFKQLTDDQVNRILLRSRQMVKQYFDIDIIFSDVETLAVEEIFNALSEALIKARQEEIVDIQHFDKQVREEMQQSVFETLKNYAGNKDKVIDFAQPYLLHPEIKPKGFIELSYALVDTLVARLKYWHSELAGDSRPVLDGSPYNEWVWWDSLGYSELPYEIVITNQLVASAEKYAMDVHSSIRGGITAGTTTYNKNSALSSYVYIMVYPMLNDSQLLTGLRQDETYSDEQIVNYSAALLTHEIGHLLLHLGHPFGQSGCIMSPTVMLNYRDWYDNLDAEQCALGSNRQMVPGVANIDYNRRW
jgi:hypothetical protein